MIHYIFSDKTGTLTKNIMDFKRMTVAEVSYGCKNPSPQNYAPGVTNVNFEDELFFRHLDNPNEKNHINVKKFIECLGICHTVITEEKKDLKT